MSTQSFINVKIKFQVVAISEYWKIKCMQTSGDDEVVTFDLVESKYHKKSTNKSSLKMIELIEWSR